MARAAAKKKTGSRKRAASPKATPTRKRRSSAKRRLTCAELAALVRKHGSLDLYFPENDSTGGEEFRVRRITSSGRIDYGFVGSVDAYLAGFDTRRACHNKRDPRLSAIGQRPPKLEVAIMQMDEYMRNLPASDRVTVCIRVTNTGRIL